MILATAVADRLEDGLYNSVMYLYNMKYSRMDKLKILFILSIFLFFTTAQNAISANSRDNDIYNAQVKLQALGYYSGRVDGIYGKKTRKSILEFQHNNGLKETGKIDKPTTYKLSHISIKEYLKYKAKKVEGYFGIKNKKHSLLLYIYLFAPFVATLALIDLNVNGSRLIISLLVCSTAIYLLIILYEGVESSGLDHSVVIFCKFMYFCGLVKFIFKFLIKNTLRSIWILLTAITYINITLHSEAFFLTFQGAIKILEENLSVQSMIFNLKLFTSGVLLPNIVFFIFIFFVTNILYFSIRDDFGFTKQRILLLYAGYISTIDLFKKNNGDSMYVSCVILIVVTLLLIEPYAVSSIKRKVVSIFTSFLYKKIKRKAVFKFLVFNIATFPHFTTIAPLNYIIFYFFLKNRLHGDIGSFQFLIFTVLFVAIQYSVIFIYYSIYKEFVEKNEFGQEILYNEIIQAGYFSLFIGYFSLFYHAL